MISQHEWVRHLETVAGYARAAGVPRSVCEDAVRCGRIEPSEASNELVGLLAYMVDEGLEASPELVEYIRPLAKAYDVIEEFAAEFLAPSSA